MVSVRLIIHDETIKEIKDCYGKSDYNTIETVVNNILYRYLATGYFDEELPIEDSNYVICNSCGHKSKDNTIIDLDGKNLGEYLICKNCGFGTPEVL